MKKLIVVIYWKFIQDYLKFDVKHCKRVLLETAGIIKQQ